MEKHLRLLIPPCRCPFSHIMQVYSSGKLRYKRMGSHGQGDSSFLEQNHSRVQIYSVKTPSRAQRSEPLSVITRDDKEGSLDK